MKTEYMRYRDYIRALERRLDWLKLKRRPLPGGSYIEAEYFATKHAIELMKAIQEKHSRKGDEE